MAERGCGPSRCKRPEVERVTSGYPDEPWAYATECLVAVNHGACPFASQKSYPFAYFQIEWWQIYRTLLPLLSYRYYVYHIETSCLDSSKLGAAQHTGGVQFLLLLSRLTSLRPYNLD